MIGNSSNNRRQYYAQPKSTTLENLGVYKGVIDMPQTYHPLMERCRDYLIQKGTDGMGFADLQRHFHSFDRDHTKTIHPEEFKMSFQKMNMEFSDQEISDLFAMFDIYGYGYINYDEFMFAVRGQIHPRRRQLIAWAWYNIDYNKEGWVDPEDVIGRFNASMHPDCKSGFKTPQECFRDFLKAFEVSGEIPGKVSRLEFENYYYNVSASVERDDYFEQLMRFTWNLDYNNGGSDFFRRYNVMHQDGRESIEFMMGDWDNYGRGRGMDMWNDDSIMARFRSQGIYPRSFSRFEGQWDPFQEGYFTNQRRYTDGSMGSYNGYYGGDWNYNQGFSPRRNGNNMGRYNYGNYGGNDYGSYGGRSGSPRAGSPRNMRQQSQGMMGTSGGMDNYDGRARDGSPRSSPRASPRSSPRRYGMY